MASQMFLANMNQMIHKELKGVLAQAPDIRVLGSTEDQYAGLGESLKTALVPFASTSYEAAEFVYVGLQLNDQDVPTMHFAAPVLNIKDKSVPGVGVFVSAVTAPSAETYVERMVGFKYQLLPLNLVKTGKKYKAIIKEGLIRSQAVNMINSDKKLCNKLEGARSQDVAKPFPGRGYYKISFDYDNYPGGMFCVVPFKGKSVLIARDAGTTKSKVDRPVWGWKDRFGAFKGVASALRNNPDQAAFADGQFFVDTTLEIALPPVLASIG
jgi:hypothetical protein